MSTTPPSEAMEGEPASTQEVEAPGTPLGRAWVAPALLLAGLIALGRVEILARLAQQGREVGLERARWSVLAEWPAELVQGIIMGAAAAAVVWSARGGRRVFGIAMGAAILTSALSGWPIAAADEIPHSAMAGVPAPWEIAAVCGIAAVMLSALAYAADASRLLNGLLSNSIVLGILAVACLGWPAWQLWQYSENAPRMPVREVLAELDTSQRNWKVARENPKHPSRADILSPFADIRFTRAEHDTGDKVALLMSPPCEVSFVIPKGAEGSRLLLAAQIDGRYTDRGLDVEGRPELRKPSPIDELGLDSLSVGFSVERDGTTLFSETLIHSHGETGREREWQHVGEGGYLDVEPGQVITLRTEYGDGATATAFGENELRCGFGGLVLERWRDEPRQRSTTDTPNILFITVDTLRADRMSCYGYEKPTTPNLDALAERGLLFERAFATSSWTWPSTASLMTGLLPYEHGVVSNSACNLNHVYETLAEVLQGRGYTTSAISCNPLIDETRQFDQGFERFNASAHMRMTDEVIGDIESELRELADSRFFLYLHLADPHTPHKPLPSELERLGGEEPEHFPDRVEAGVIVDGMDYYAGKLIDGEGCDNFGTPHPERVVPPEHMQWISDRYDASVGTGDHYLGQVFGWLDELELTEKTIIVVTSDHGEELFDHGMLAHGHAVWRELVHVPLLMAGPGIEEGRRLFEEVSNRHVAPTLATIGGGQLAAVEAPLNLASDELYSPTVFYQTSKGYWNGHRNLEVQGLRNGDYSVHYAVWGGKWNKPRSELGEARIFSIADDFEEITDLMIDEKYQLEAADSVQAIRSSVIEQRERRLGGAAGIGASALKALKALGYTGTDESLEDALNESDGEDEDEPAKD